MRAVRAAQPQLQPPLPPPPPPPLRTYVIRSTRTQDNNAPSTRMYSDSPFHARREGTTHARWSIALDRTPIISTHRHTAGALFSNTARQGTWFAAHMPSWPRRVIQ